MELSFNNRPMVLVCERERTKLEPGEGGEEKKGRGMRGREECNVTNLSRRAIQILLPQLINSTITLALVPFLEVHLSRIWTPGNVLVYESPILSSNITTIITGLITGVLLTLFLSTDT